MPGGKGSQSQSTTAESLNRNGQDPYNQVSQPMFYDNDVENASAQSNLAYQLNGIRGVNPDSNINLQNDINLVESKKDKCIEIFRSSSLVHEII